MKVFNGNERDNTTLLVENNDTVSIGAPVRVKVSTGAIITLQVQPPARNGEAKVLYKVVGAKYKWYERPFIRMNFVAYIFFLIAFSIALTVIVVCSSVILMFLLVSPVVNVCGLPTLCFGGVSCCIFWVRSAKKRDL